MKLGIETALYPIRQASAIHVMAHTRFHIDFTLFHDVAKLSIASFYCLQYLHYICITL